MGYRIFALCEEDLQQSLSKFVIAIVGDIAGEKCLSLYERFLKSGPNY